MSIWRAMLMVVCCAALAGCSIDPGAKYIPAMLRAPEPAPAPVDPAPDVRLFLKANLASVFLPAANARDIKFSPAKPAYGEWTSCVQATVNGAMGNTLGRRIYLVNIAHNKVSRQELVAADHWCHAEPYEAL